MSRTTSDIEVHVVHETYVEITVPRVDHDDPDADAYLWVCACGDGGDESGRSEAVLEARRHERRAS